MHGMYTIVYYSYPLVYSRVKLPYTLFAVLFRGMVSLPAIKNLMLQASRLLKGAAVADRVEIDGVSCFILSRDPAPELVAALKRQQRRKTTMMPRLSTINESKESIPQHSNLPKTFAGTGGRYRQRDVIFHLTGGGFFAHTIASVRFPGRAYFPVSD
jgi:hypothetical protein